MAHAERLRRRAGHVSWWPIPVCTRLDAAQVRTGADIELHTWEHTQSARGWPTGWTVWETDGADGTFWWTDGAEAGAQYASYDQSGAQNNLST